MMSKVRLLAVFAALALSWSAQAQISPNTMYSGQILQGASQAPAFVCIQGSNNNLGFTVSGSSATVGSINKPTCGTITAGTTGTSTITITMGGGQTSDWAWLCTAYDITTPAAGLMIAYTTNSCTVQIATTTNDVILFTAFGL
jgi:hypothetical protein